MNDPTKLYWISYEMNMSSTNTWDKCSTVITTHPLKWEKENCFPIRFGFETLYRLLNWKEVNLDDLPTELIEKDPTKEG